MLRGGSEAAAWGTGMGAGQGARLRLGAAPHGVPSLDFVSGDSQTWNHAAISPSLPVKGLVSDARLGTRGPG